MGFQVLGLALNLLGIGLGAAGQGQGPEVAQALVSGVVGVASSLLGLGIGFVIILGCQKMKNLESYNFAMAANILAMIPCFSPCCIIGLPVGIWGLTVLNDPLVRNEFR